MLGERSVGMSWKDIALTHGGKRLKRDSRRSEKDVKRFTSKWSRRMAKSDPENALTKLPKHRIWNI